MKFKEELQKLSNMGRRQKEEEQYHAFLNYLADGVFKELREAARNGKTRYAIDLNVKCYFHGYNIYDEIKYLVDDFKKGTGVHCSFIGGTTLEFSWYK